MAEGPWFGSALCDLTQSGRDEKFLCHAEMGHDLPLWVAGKKMLCFPAARQTPGPHIHSTVALIARSAVNPQATAVVVCPPVFCKWTEGTIATGNPRLA